MTSGAERRIRDSAKLCMLFWLCAAGASPTYSAAPLTYSSVRAVKQLHNDEAGLGLPVKFEAQVLWHAPIESLFLEADGAGVFGVASPAMTRGLERGDWVRIAGKTASGEFGPIVVCERVEFSRHGALPPARYLTAAVLADRDLENVRVKARGRLSRIRQVSDSSESLGILSTYGQEMVLNQVPGTAPIKVSRK